MSVRATRFPWGSLLTLAITAALAAGAVSCGGGSSSTSPPPMNNPPQGTVSTTLSDPPSCTDTYDSVFITVRSVQAHISSTADESSSGWQELAPNLASAPVQVDLLSLPQGGCTLATLGANISLPAGDYQQIRLILLANNASSGPSPNACSSVNAFNCVVLAGGTVRALNLSSQANTGLKIPPGQIVGGPIRVADGQHVDLNIDFNACASIVVQGNNQYRLRPTLTAGQVSSISSGMSGTVLDSMTMMPLDSTAGTAEVQVALEQPDMGGIDRILMQAAAGANGSFNFCPVPMGTFDLVAVGQDGNGVTYGPTVLTGVSGGSALGNIPLIAQPMGSTDAATIDGVVSSENAMAGASIDASLSALQTVDIGGGTMRDVTIPLFNSSVSNIATAMTPVAMVTCPMNTFCEGYSLIVPAQNPSVGAFMSGGTTFGTPAMGDVFFKVEAKAFAPMSGGTASCSPSSQTVTEDNMVMPLKVLSGMTTTAKQIDFTGCM